MSSEVKYFIFAVFIYIALLSIALYLAKRKNISTRDLLLAKAQPLNIVVLIFTFAATLMSAFFMVGMPGFAYTHGALLWPYVIFGDVLGLLFLYLVGSKFIEKYKAYDIGKDENSKALSPLAIIFADKPSRVICLVIVSIFIVPYLGVQIGGFGKLLSATSNGEIPVVYASLVTLLLLWGYSTLTGIRGIAYTDFAQGIILVGSALVVASWFLYNQFGGLTPFFAELSSHPELMDNPGPKGFGSYPILFSSLIMFSAIMITQPQFLTRLMLIGDENPKRYLRHLILGLAIALSIFTLPILLMGLGGALAYPGLSGGDQLFGKILSDHLSLFPAIFVSVCVLAAAMSTADSILFSISQMVTKDVVVDIMGMDGANSTTKLAVRSVLLILAVFAFAIGISSNELIVQLSGLSFAGCLQVAPAIIAGLFHKNYSAIGSAISMAIGILSVLMLTSMKAPLFFGFHHAIPSVVLASITYALISMLLARNKSVEG